MKIIKEGYTIPAKADAIEMAQDIDNFVIRESLNEEVLLNESYAQLWKQFAQLININDSDFDLHHVYIEGSSKNNKRINFSLMPTIIHRKFPKNKNRHEAIKLYEKLKIEFPEYFKTIRVSFDLFNPPEEITNYIVSELNDINKKRHNNSRNKNKLSPEEIYSTLVNNSK